MTDVNFYTTFAAELYLRTREIIWEDWKALRIDQDGKAVQVIVKTPTKFNPLSILYSKAGKWLETYLRELTT